MAGSLAPVRERLGWARERFKELEAAMDAFVREQPNESAPGIAIQMDGKAGVWSLSLLFPPDLPAALAKLTGEALYHLRGTLDNLAWQLVLANDGVPGSHTEFPVFKDKAEFERRAPRKMRGMSDAAKAAIKGLQPYMAWPESPDNATIWKVHDLNNIDKHRLPHLTCIWLAWVKGDAVVGANGRVAYRHERGCVKNDAELIRVVWDPALTPPDTKMKVNFEVSIDVAIRNPGQIEFVTDRKEPVESVPIRHLFEVGLDYMDTTVLPLFESEFA